MIRILLIGPLPPPMGGNTRHFQTLCDDLERSEKFKLRLINTSRGDAHGSVLHNSIVALKTAWEILGSLGNVDIVSYHASDRGMFLFGPLVRMLSALAGKPTVFRPFGGSLGDHYRECGNFGKWVVRKFVLSANVVLLQTRRMVGQLQDKAPGRLVWFSTYIKAPASPTREHSGRDSCSRFVFLGHLLKTKGIETILEVAERLPAGCVIDLYGPLDEYRAEEIGARGRGRVNYRGFLTHDEVNAVLWDYDCLVLPTFYPGEGYPGVIAEAFAHGLPVIVTKWLAIPEIVDESCGILMAPGNVNELAEAIGAMHGDSALWNRLKEGARARAAQFDHAIWSRKFEEICEGLVRR